MSLLSAYSWLSMALDLAQVVLEVRKNLKPTKFYMLNNICFNNFPKKLIPGDVRAQVLQEPVGASHADQGRKSGVPPTFLDPGGQAGSNGTPHLGFGSSPCIPQGGSLLYYIYRFRFEVFGSLYWHQNSYNSTYPIPTVVPTGVVNDTKCEMSLPSVLVTFE